MTPPVPAISCLRQGASLAGVLLLAAGCASAQEDSQANARFTVSRGNAEVARVMADDAAQDGARHAEWAARRGPCEAPPAVNARGPW